MGDAERVAQALLEIKAIGFPSEPIRFKSGILSPVYVDNRILPFHRKEWGIIIQSLVNLIHERELQFNIVAGIETAGIPHSAVLGWELKKPSVFIRKTEKDHGTRKKVEGGNVRGEKVLLIEDHVTTAGSSLEGIRSLRNEGGIVDTALSITSYGFQEAVDAFAAEQVAYYPLVTFDIILTTAARIELITKKEMEIIQDWFADPYAWTGKRE